MMFFIPDDVKSPVWIENPEQAEFFIAIAKKRGHSFVMLGVMIHDKPMVFSRVGKICLPEKKGLFGEVLNLNVEISYEAYAITYEHYLRFLDLIANILPSGKKIHAYQREPNSNMFVYSKINDARSKSTDVSEEEKKILSHERCSIILSTCRNMAIKLLEYVLSNREQTDKTSRLFFRDLPSKICFEEGRTHQYFYVRPNPPTAYCASKDSVKYKRLSKIYQRMEHLISKDEQNPNTKTKFDALKKLYVEQAGIADISIDVALQSVLQWHEDHRNIISELRKPSFFTTYFGLKSSTESMSLELEDELLHLNNACKGAQ